MRTPFPEKFILDSFEITRQVIDRGYFILSQVPDSNSLSLLIDETNDVLASNFSIVEISLDNLFLYTHALIGQYVLSWLQTSSSSSSSSGSSSELVPILEDKIGESAQVRYISNN